MKNITYIPIIKTSDAEFRCLDSLSDNVKNNLTPLFELTRSRVSKEFPEGNIFKRLNKIKEVFGERRFILDLHSELVNQQIRDLQDSSNGYEQWVQFAISCKDVYPELIPAVQISDEGVDTEEEYKERLRQQVISLDKHFNSIVYRFPIAYEYFEDDLSVICSALSTKKLICIIDAEYILKGKSDDNARKAIEILQALSKYAQIGRVGLSGTSFPKNPTEFGRDEYGEYLLEECLFFQKVNTAKSGLKLIYSDYATVNPIINDQAGGRGWVPRIDMPTKEELFYHRSRKGKKEMSYVSSYGRVAKMVVNESRYKVVKKQIPNCWGINQIEMAADGNPPGLSPSFWISVRMSIHITLRTMFV